MTNKQTFRLRTISAFILWSILALVLLIGVKSANAQECSGCTLWTGAVSTDYSNGDNWSSGVPYLTGRMPLVSPGSTVNVCIDRTRPDGPNNCSNTSLPTITVAGCPTTAGSTCPTTVTSAGFGHPNEQPDPYTDVSLTSMKATGLYKQRIVEVKWVTVSETNNDRFFLERSTSIDGPWERIDEQDGLGTSPIGKTYFYRDYLTSLKQPISKNIYYRLVDLETTGKFTFRKPFKVIWTDLLQSSK